MTPPSIPNASELIADIKQMLPTAQSAWLYGSAAKAQLRPDSDIDLAVFMPATEEISRWEWIKIASEFAAKWGRDVDLVKFQAASPVLQKEILTHGQLLFADDPDMIANYALFALSQYREYMDRYASEFKRIGQSGRVLSP